MRTITAFFLFSLTCLCFTTHTQVTLMLDPLGDAHHAGRSIESMFERGITMQLVEKIKEACKKQMPKLRIIVTRAPGESIETLQHASFANKLQVDLYISIGCYYQTSTPTHLAIYQYCADPLTAQWHTPEPWHFYSIDQAYLYSYHQSEQYGKNLITTLQSNTALTKHCSPLGCFKVPCTPLQGIKSPALYVEIGLVSQDSWKHFVDPLVQALEKVIHEIPA